MTPEITQADWLAMARAYGEVLCDLSVYKRVCAEQAGELAMLRQQLAQCADAVHAAPDAGEEG